MPIPPLIDPPIEDKVEFQVPIFAYVEQSVEKTFSPPI